MCAKPSSDGQLLRQRLGRGAELETNARQKRIWGSVWMAPILRGFSSDFFCSVLLLSVVCQASYRGLRHGAGMQFEEQSPHRFRELYVRARDWFTLSGTLKSLPLGQAISLPGSIGPETFVIASSRR
jgi:hypothetical protein